MIRMDEFNKIRKAFYDDGNTINEIAIKFKRSWATVDKIIKSSRDDRSIDRKSTRRPKVSSQEVKDAIANKLLEEKKLRVKKKQRLTAKKIYEELIQSGVYHGSIRRMQELVKEVRDQLVQTQPESYLPLEFTLGSTVQVDHGEVECIVEDNRRIHFLFVMSIPGTTLRYCQIFATKAQEAWGEFHERAFQFFNGMFPRVIYDNDTVLVKSLKEDKRLMTEFALHLIEHYGFEAIFCNPASGNEKGSVENAVGYCRRNYLNGCPVFANTQEANSYLEEQCKETIKNSTHYRSGESLTDIRNELESKLQPLFPSKMWRRWVKRQVNHYQLVEVDCHRYSAPEKFVLAYLRVGIGAEIVDLYDGNSLVASHTRQFIVGKDSLFLDHYLGQLCRKPGALWDCKAVQEYTKDELFLAL